MSDWRRAFMPVATDDALKRALQIVRKRNQQEQTPSGCEIIQRLSVTDVPRVKLGKKADERLGTGDTVRVLLLTYWVQNGGHTPFAFMRAGFKFSNAMSIFSRKALENQRPIESADVELACMGFFEELVEDEPAPEGAAAPPAPEGEAAECEPPRKKAKV